ncbi:MAG: DUF4364 family protein [Clostridiaceae bacterium]|nr:DUF4364 family protein [Clostridiaceae bacterium]
MIFDSGVLADKKLMILYLLSKMDIPMTKSQITNAILENNLIDFFTFQQCISDLEESGMIIQMTHQKKQCFITTDGGKKAIEVFEQRISKNTYGIINNYVSKNKESLKKESQVIAEYNKIGDKEYIVNLKVIEKELILMDLKLSVVSAKQAKQVCEKWKNSSEKIFGQLIGSLIN